jgi:signal transduction histidine kinase
MTRTGDVIQTASTLGPAPRVRPSWLRGDPGIVELITSRDWSQTPLGPIERWPENLRSTVSLALNSSFPINIAWGPGAVQIWNEAYALLAGDKHPGAFGSDFRDCWASAWPAIGGAFEEAWSGRTAYLEDQAMFLDRHGYLEETSFTFSLSPIRDESGAVAGLFNPVMETTERVLAGRRTHMLRELAGRATQARSASQAAALAIDVLSGVPQDLPFALLYLSAVDGRPALEAHTGLTPAAAAALLARPPANSAVAAVLTGGVARYVDDVEREFGTIHAGPYVEPIREALVLPMSAATAATQAGVLVLGLSTRLPQDESYRGFMELAAQGVGAVLTSAQAVERERERAEQLEQIALAKSTFLSNVSHEFRTPLTLMLGPLEDELADPGLEPERRERLATAHRNSMRLMRLVNALLEFSRLESGRVEACYRPTDLASFTADLCSLFRSATERAGLRLDVDCEPLDEPIFVDNGMWETIVTNLLSNAFKHTFEGTIAITLRRIHNTVELAVADTGIGIPADELPRLFERFHRVKDARSRTIEGSGIGLSLVRELARLHGGDVRIASAEGRGTTVTVTISAGAAHLPPEQVAAGALSRPARTDHAGAHVEDVLGWLDTDTADGDTIIAERPEDELRPRLLVADDNADMRAHLVRLLERRFDTVVVADGAAALEAIMADPPDLVLADVMMPRLDGVSLVAALREHERTRSLPVILLSARAGEGAAAEGINAGADDYLVKPFSARELIARVSGTLALARQRQEAARELEQINRELEAAADAKTVFVANVSHEIRTPMNAIVGMTGLLGSSSLDDRQADYVETIRRSGEHLLSVVNDILDQTKLDVGRLRIDEHQFDLPLVCEEAVELVAGGAFAKGVEIAALVDATIPRWTCGDAGRVRQILVNLLSNAVDFTAEGEVVLRVTVGEIDRAGRAPLRFAVSDTGCGIPADQLCEVFRPFTQLEQPATGARSATGLGLTISRQLAELMGGRIDVTSAVGVGSTFVLELPLIVSPAPPHDAPLPLSRRDHHVLIVEDAAPSREALALQAAALGMTSAATSSPEQALDWIRAGEPFDLAIVGDELPGVRAGALARELAASSDGRPLRTILLTSAPAPVDRDESELFGALLAKPVRRDALLDAVSSLCGDGGDVVDGGADPAALDAGPAARAERRILVVDDNALNRKVAVRMLEACGFAADCAVDGGDAIAALEADAYDIVFMDLQMPGIDGVQATREIRRRLAPERQPFIVGLTASGLDEDRDACLAAGMDSHVTKPFRSEVLLDVIAASSRR